MNWGDRSERGCKKVPCEKLHPAVCPRSLDLVCMEINCDVKLHTKKCKRPARHSPTPPNRTWPQYRSSRSGPWQGPSNPTNHPPRGWQVPPPAGCQAPGNIWPSFHAVEAGAHPHPGHHPDNPGGGPPGLPAVGQTGAWTIPLQNPAAGSVHGWLGTGRVNFKDTAGQVHQHQQPSSMVQGCRPGTQYQNTAGQGHQQSTPIIQGQRSGNINFQERAGQVHQQPTLPMQGQSFQVGCTTQDPAVHQMLQDWAGNIQRELLTQTEVMLTSKVRDLIIHLGGQGGPRPSC